MELSIIIEFGRAAKPIQTFHKLVNNIILTHIKSLLVLWSCLLETRAWITQYSGDGLVCLGMEDPKDI